ncbi:MarR family winged helix-turn-helix transcriptional regulator [Phytohabitans aurantiacus]|uniref:MarR family transcriptional regulator n=1 Tax=Phytohabitans aurantiacus TaxID=3016789 RepID=A0ABQ5QYU0_9ACTN|nr:MarR family transcriptional regulator [Phytohabitans aurantiacus]GLH99102.1 MarR family transcriptional regulator [Phytohabitans aurantiacus]
MRWLSDDEQRAWRALVGVIMLVPSALDTQLQRDSQLTHFAYTVMAMLSESPTRSARMSELAALANGSQSRLSHLVARLEERGWVRRERTPEDGRGYVAVLTDAGYEKVVESAPGHVGEVRKLVFDALTPEQVKRMEEVARAIIAKVDPDETC